MRDIATYESNASDELNLRKKFMLIYEKIKKSKSKVANA